MNFWTSQDEFPGSISLPYGIKTSHTWHEIGKILRITNDYQIGAFVELGSHVGGLASTLLPIGLYRSFQYMGVEHDPSIVHPTVYNKIYFGDILDPVTIASINNFRRGLKTFIYCDGGNKIKEMFTYYHQLQAGDIIACHDYFDYQTVVDLKNFGVDDTCGCVPEVKHKDLDFLFDDATFEILPDHLLEGTRIMGFIKK